MSIRQLPSSWLVRFFAVAIVVLTVTPFTQPFSTIGPTDLFDLASDTKAASKPVKEVATVEAIVARVSGGAEPVEGLVIVSPRLLGLRQGTPLVLRI